MLVPQAETCDAYCFKLEARDTDPRGSKMPIFKDCGSKNHTLHGILIPKSLNVEYLDPLGIVCWSSLHSPNRDYNRSHVSLPKKGLKMFPSWIL